MSRIDDPDAVVCALRGRKMSCRVAARAALRALGPDVSADEALGYLRARYPEVEFNFEKDSSLALALDTERRRLARECQAPPDLHTLARLADLVDAAELGRLARLAGVVGGWGRLVSALEWLSRTQCKPATPPGGEVPS